MSNEFLDLISNSVLLFSSGILVACAISLTKYKNLLRAAALISFLVLLTEVLVQTFSAYRHENYLPSDIVEERLNSTNKAFNLVEMSSIFSGDVVHCGILREYDGIDIRSIAPSIKNYQFQKTIVFWSFNFKPSEFVRKGEAIFVKGKVSESNTVFFVLLNSEICKGVTSIIPKPE